MSTQHASKKITGILLLNLGTPDAPTVSAVRRYLREFLSDRRVVNLPRPLWWFILNFLVLPFRPRRSAHAYQKIWTEQGSPLLINTQNIRNKLQAAFSGDPSVNVMCAMRYGSPSIAAVLREFQQYELRELIVLPLYPQYSSTTTASCFDEISEILQTWRFIPQLTFFQQYADHPDYIDAIANRITEFWQQHGRAQKLVFSYHGLPKKLLEQGDPYYCFCHKTTRLVAEKLQLDEHDFVMTFQSRFGKATWLQPYTDATLKNLAKENCTNVQIVCPGFAADCLETLEEIALQNRDFFLAAGGKQLRYIPALNDHDDHIHALKNLITKVVTQ